MKIKYISTGTPLTDDQIAEAKAIYASKYPKLAAWQAAGMGDHLWTDELEEELAREIADDPESDPEVFGPAMTFEEAMLWSRGRQK